VSCTQAPGAARAAGSCPLALPGSLPLGTYELRLLANNGYGRLASSNPFTIDNGVATTLMVSPPNVGAGTSVSATWSGIASPTTTDWIGVYTPGSGNSAYLAWIYVSCTQAPGAARSSGSCSFMLPASLAAGSYELRLLSNNGFGSLAVSSAFSVGAAAAATSALGP